MNLSEPFIRRPVMTTLIMFALLVFGIIGYHLLPVSNVPDMDFPTISVSASLPGASAQTMASSVATPLEQQFSTIAGISQMTSSSSLGSTSITIQFDLDRDIDAAAQDVQAAISAAIKSLPQNLPNPPTYRKVNPADAPILYLALSSSALPLSTVDDYAEQMLAQRISMVDGVAQVNVYGSQKYAVRAQLNPELLASYQIGLNDVVTAISNANVNLPTGNLNGVTQAPPILVNGQLYNAAAYRPIIVAYRNGAAVRLSQLGDVIDSVENDKVASWYNNTRAIVLAVQRQPGTNTLAVIDGIYKILPSFQAQLPKDIKISTLYDRGPSIQTAVDDVQHTLIIAAVLVVLVIFVFLRNASATIIPSIALPFSLIATFAVMSILDFSLDIVSLMALTLTVGFIVDDAIVMLENITRHMEHGESPMQAALNGSKEISFTIVSMTISLIAVFIPFLFMGGIIGRFFHEFAVTICVAILFSGFISLTLTPMMCSRFLKSQEQQRSYEWFKVSERIFQKGLKLYEESLQWVLKHQRQTLQVFLGTLVAVILLFMIVPKGFMPDQDIGQLLAYTEADGGISFPAMVQKQQQVAAIISKDPDVQGSMSSVGAGGISPALNTGRVFIRLTPPDQRSRTADEIITDLRRNLKGIPGIRVYIQNVPPIQIGGRLSKSTYQYTLQDSDYNELQDWTAKYQVAFKALPALIDVTNDLQITTPQVTINIDRDKASALGVTASEIETTLGNAFGTQEISNIYTSLSTYEVIAEVLPEYQETSADLNQIYLKSSSGSLVPLNAIATVTQTSTPITVNHQGQLPAATLSFNLRPGYSLGDAVSEINGVKANLGPPATLVGSFQGTAQTFQASQQGMLLLILLAIFVIYIILGILYESFIHPLTILTGLPAAVVGGLLTLLIFNVSLDLYGFIGLIMLFGIVKKNAIMMIDFALEAQRKEHKTPQEAIYQACLIRFRPIMMTTAAAILGTLPIALAFGSSAEAQRPLGLVVVGGLLFSQFLTLYITPVFYLYFESLSKKYKLEYSET